MSSYPIYGYLPAQFESLRTVISENVAEHDELGFQFCVMQHGEPLIDIRAGWTNRRRTKEVAEDTLFAVFSSGKAAAALVIAWLVEEDRIGYDQRIETIWPEFAQAGKETLTIPSSGIIRYHQSRMVRQRLVRLGQNNCSTRAANSNFQTRQRLRLSPRDLWFSGWGNRETRR